jgi:hypothetical protein
LLAISNQQQQQLFGNNNSNSSSANIIGQKVSYSQVAKKPTSNSLESQLINSMVDMRSNNSISPLSFASNSSTGSCGNSNNSSMMSSSSSGILKPKLVTIKPSLDDVKVMNNF